MGHPPPFTWLDTRPDLRRWFANWLVDQWQMIFREAILELHSPADFKRFAAMERGMEQHRRRLQTLTVGDQLKAIQGLASKCALSTTRERIEDELRRFL